MRIRNLAVLAAASALTMTIANPGEAAQSDNRPWMNRSLSPDARADLVLARMSREEKLRLVFGYFGTDFPSKRYTAPDEVRQGSAGYVPGIPRLGIPPQWQTDAGIGVATQGGARVKSERTALPSGIATAASWDPEVAFRGGAMIGSEARSSGFNVMLAGGVNLFTRAAQRPKLRIWRRGSAAGREHRRRPCRRHPVQRHHLDDQALRSQ